MSNAAQPAATPPKQKGRGRGLLFVVIGLILGLGGGGAGYWAYAMRSAAAAKPPEPPKIGIIAMEPFVVNLADEGGSRFLRLTLALAVEGEERAKETTADKVLNARLRSAILERLTQQTSEHLVTP